MKSGLAILFAATFGIQPLPQPDGPLEPSVQNEVDHAIALGERWLAAHVSAVAGRPPYQGGGTNAAAAVAGRPPYQGGGTNATAVAGRPPYQGGGTNAAAVAGRPPYQGGTNVAAVAGRPPYQGDLFATNGLTRERIAIKLISSQRAGGWWLMETNAAPTRLAIEILKGL